MSDELFQPAVLETDFHPALFCLAKDFAHAPREIFQQAGHVRAGIEDPLQDSPGIEAFQLDSLDEGSGFGRQVEIGVQENADRFHRGDRLGTGLLNRRFSLGVLSDLWG